MPFKPTSTHWSGTRAVLLVHGIGDASTGGDGAFPLDVLKTALGDDAGDVALYRLNYDFINDWLAEKTQLAAGIREMKRLLTGKFGGDDSAATIADYAGDVIWPVLSADLRLAVRDAYIAQLQQIQIDRGESALARGDDPLDYQVTIVAHSLGCFHTYEVLTACADEPAHELRPASDLFTLRSVILMASPVQLIRTVGGAISALVPQASELASLSRPLAIPSETRRGRTTPITPDFVSVTGDHDPVGGHLLGRRLDWAYMNIPGQRSIIVPQTLVALDTRAGTANALAHAVAAGGPQINDPHSWTAYIETQRNLLRGALVA